jgi:hypothetical protein
MNDRLRVNAPDVTYESFDAEVLAINLRSGNYYSLRESAVPMWLLITQGLSAPEVCRRLADTWPGAEAALASAVDGFIARLVGENLLVRLDGAPPATTPASVALPATFVPPVLDCYTDMQQMLLMDPIHEVDASGWPMAKAPDKEVG